MGSKCRQQGQVVLSCTSSTEAPVLRPYYPHHLHLSRSPLCWRQRWEKLGVLWVVDKIHSQGWFEWEVVLIKVWGHEWGILLLEDSWIMFRQLLRDGWVQHFSFSGRIMCYSLSMAREAMQALPWLSIDPTSSNRSHLFIWSLPHLKIFLSFPLGPWLPTGRQGAASPSTVEKEHAFLWIYLFVFQDPGSANFVKSQMVNI